MTTATAYTTPTTRNVIEAFDAGWKAHTAEATLAANPHPDGTALAFEWEDGWFAAAAAKATRYGG